MLVILTDIWILINMVGMVENQAFIFIVINILQSNTRADEKNYLSYGDGIANKWKVNDIRILPIYNL